MRATLRVIHRYLGLLLVLPLPVQGVSGAILALEPILDGIGPVPAPGMAERPSIDAIVAAARSVAEDGMHATRYVPPSAVRPAEVWFAPAAGAPAHGLQVVSVDPRRLTPIWPPDPRNGAMEWLRRLHTNFLLPDPGGRAIVGWTGAGLLLLAILGVPIWWPAPREWRAGFTVSATARGVRLYRRLHGAVGIWTVVLLMIAGGTGAILGFPRTIRGALGVTAPVRVAPPADSATTTDTRAPGHTLDAATALAHAAAPGTVLRVLFLPTSAGAPIRVLLAPPGSEGATAVTTVTIDPAGTRVLGVQDARTMSRVELLLRWAHDIHFGQGLGPLWLAMTIAAGVALPVFAITGTAMWFLRNRLRKRFDFGPSELSPGE